MAIYIIVGPISKGILFVIFRPRRCHRCLCGTHPNSFPLVVQGGWAKGFKVPRGSYPTPFLGRLLFKITDPNHKTRYPKKGVGYEPLGI